RWFGIDEGSLAAALKAAESGDVVQTEGGADFSAEGELEFSTAGVTLIGNGATAAAAWISADDIVIEDMRLKADVGTNEGVVTVVDAKGLTLQDVHISAAGRSDSHGVRFQNVAGADFSGFTMIGGTITD